MNIRGLGYKGNTSNIPRLQEKGSTRPKQKYTEKTNNYTRSCSDKKKKHN